MLFLQQVFSTGRENPQAPKGRQLVCANHHPRHHGVSLSVLQYYLLFFHSLGQWVHAVKFLLIPQLLALGQGFYPCVLRLKANSSAEFSM